MRADRLFSLVLCGALLASPVLSAPQSRPGQSGMSAQSGPGSMWAPPATEQMSRFEREEQRRALSMTEQEAEDRYGEERVALANRVQALIDEGKCREARAMASEAGERQMALRVRQTCRSR